MRANSQKLKSVQFEIEVRCSLFFPPSLIKSVISPFPIFMANYLWLGLLKSNTNWRDEGVWEVASLSKDSCLIINYWGRNRKYCWNSPGSATQDVVHLIGLSQQQPSWGLKKTLLIFRKTLGEKGTRHCCIFIYTLNTSGHCCKSRTQVLIPKAESLPALLLLALLSSLQDHLCYSDGYCCRKWVYCAFAILFKHCCFGNLYSNHNPLYFIYYLQK